MGATEIVCRRQRPDEQYRQTSGLTDGRAYTGCHWKFAGKTMK